jgi:hypothetical protein
LIVIIFVKSPWRGHITPPRPGQSGVNGRYGYKMEEQHKHKLKYNTNQQKCRESLYRKRKTVVVLCGPSKEENCGFDTV